ncbi:PhoX family phosphatase [Tepidimonas taiwanensis]|uniref:Phosphatase n=1 Tax=Tepidimonas taiwanensis TaxID=307486 RepID=A0A554XD59_9BURK|nr:PhoX family phosphatase [Tepidimonas taiwanensis]MCX7694018.1 PhoX family phosphatase [Tepidimonas taiwanensis]TSE33768.1 hypothetical protein Ttaiw_00341 [Tepidimonas taiwanensis]UBQ06686.1 PhoX family phosphatase [Tepidimonas taiwanensis]
MRHDTARPDTFFNDENSNPHRHASFEDILAQRLSRRQVMAVAGAAAATVATSAAAPALAAPPAGAARAGSTGPAPLQRLGFAAVGKSKADTVLVPPGYQVQVLYALGDPLFADVPAFRNDGTDTQFERRAGDHHDGMEYFGLSRRGQPDPTSSQRALLVVNHEATTDEKLTSFFLHADGGKAALPRPAAEVDKEIAIHGVSVVEIQRHGQRWQTIVGSPFNRRLTPETPMEISGPARGSRWMVTQYSVDGTRCRGTLNNCGTGKTPWGTFVTGEENWFGYFTRRADDDDARNDAREVVALNRYGRKAGAASRHGWETAGEADRYRRFDCSKTGSSADGSDDYRHEINTFGWIVEMDPYNPSAPVVKRTALGRCAHENAVFAPVKAGEPVVVYMGDDARNEYIYKFVSSAPWDPADAQAADRIAVGSKYLDHGTLYVARFDADGRGEWVELSLRNPAVAGYDKFRFESQADVVVHARIAGDAVKATRMDRPEWGGIHPRNGEVYFTLTNNSNRRVEPAKGAELAPDAANPRVYVDMKGDKKQEGNPNGHIVRLREDGGAASTRFVWDVYLFGAQADADRGLINLSGLTDDNDFSSPDGLWFSPYSGICWIQTDDGAYTDVTNCMMLAALPGRVGDGERRTLRYRKADGSEFTVTTYVGRAGEVKRFLVGPPGCEITGIAESPDGRALFVNIQHPGENTRMADVNDPSKYESQWPAKAGYGPGQRPRSATVVITRTDGGRIGT